MSTIPEVIVARHCGMSVAALSLVTDIAVIDITSSEHSSHEQVLLAVKHASQNILTLVQRFVSKDKIGRKLNDIYLPKINKVDQRAATVQDSDRSQSCVGLQGLLHYGAMGLAVTAVAVDLLMNKQ